MIEQNVVLSKSQVEEKNRIIIVPWDDGRDLILFKDYVQSHETIS